MKRLLDLLYYLALAVIVLGVFYIFRSPICRVFAFTNQCLSYNLTKCFNEQDINTCKHLGMLYEKKNKWKQRATPYYNKACDLGDGSMCFKAGSLKYRFNASRFDAIELWEKSCELEYSDGCLILGKLYEDGKLVRQNLYKAEELYNKACKLYLRQNPNIIGCNAYYNKRLAEFGF